MLVLYSVSMLVALIRLELGANDFHILKSSSCHRCHFH